MSQVNRYAFDAFLCDPVARRLLRDGAPVHVTARLFDLLHALVAHAGEPLDKDRLLQLVWGDVAVEEGNLTRAISALRKLLQDDPDAPRFIVTLPGRGYQFVATVRVTTIESGVRLSGSQASSRAPTKLRIAAGLALSAGLLGLAGGSTRLHPRTQSEAAALSRVAILPFRNVGAFGDAWFAEGMTEEIATRLSAARELRIVSRSTANRYQAARRPAPNTGQEPDVDYVLEGTVRRVVGGGGDALLRVTTQLTRTVDAAPVWVERYQRPLRELFDVQSEIAARVAIELRGALAPGRTLPATAGRTRSVEAFDAYAQGLFFARQPDPSETNAARIVAHFQHATDLDPGFARAHAALARAHDVMVRFGYDASPARRAMAARALARAESLAPRDPDVLLARSRYLLTTGGDLETAREAAADAERQRPGDADVIMARANFELIAGRWADAAAAYERVQAIDGAHAGSLSSQALVQIGLRRYAEAQAGLDRSLALEPDQVLGHVLRVWNAWLWRGDVGLARSYIDQLPPQPDWRFMEIRFLQALYERRFDAALTACEPFAGQWMRTWILVRPVVLFEAQAARLQGDRRRAARTFAAARAMLELEVRAAPGDPRVHASLAIALAGLGQKDAVRREGGRALALLRFPLAFDAATVREDVALALAMIGDVTAARDEIARLLASPAHFSEQTFRLDPRWDVLR
jgi:DNA-binding winged helix-turn-helix (wHTH) protein/TolB-like protein